MQRISLVNVAHNLIKKVLHPGDFAIDATVGNGHDTLFLIEQVGPFGKVYGFDIQLTAIESTRAKVGAYRTGENALGKATLTPENLILIQASHSDMADYISAQHQSNISAIMFNLGYLPGGDKQIITRIDSTVSALNNASRLLSSNGIITVIAYPGHQGGDMETGQVKNWCKHLNADQFKIDILYSSESNDSAPRLFVIRKTL